VLTPPEVVRPRPGDQPAQPGGKDVYQAAEIKEALKYAKDNSLPVFIRMDSDGCPGCVGMKPMWAKAQADLKGKAVFIHVDSDMLASGQYSQEATASIRPIVAGTSRIPAVWTGIAENGSFNLQKLSVAQSVSTHLDRLRGR
jgi:thiol-disulfide isomerase/thioredoxin